MGKKAESRWTRETKRVEAEKISAAAFATVSNERHESASKVARLRALRLARDDHGCDTCNSRSTQHVSTSEV